MKKFILVINICFVSILSKAQIDTNSQWTWIKGDSTPNSIGIYGTQGVSTAINKPGARDGSVSWKDASGNLWLFGGATPPQNGWNDLWKYQPSVNQWTWMKGDTTPNNIGVYGILGTADAANKPGSRSGSVSWTDLTGNLWLFGGDSYNDLWKYDPSTNQWTWVKGDSTASVAGIYGTKGTPDNANKPGTRYGSVSWTDGSGNLWLFGGRGYGNAVATFFGNLNDLWKYNPSTNQWTWVSGDNTTNTVGEYGTQGVASPANKPPGRYESISWKDASGNLWLFGGNDYFTLSVMFDYFNDLWKFDPVTNEWTWMKGDGFGNGVAIYGTRGIADPTNKPGPRTESISWADTSGNFWLFGGDFRDIYFNGGRFNDLWKYDPLTNQWMWVKGDNMFDDYGVYGTQNIAADANKPGARSNAVSWTDAFSNLWLFGGSGYAASNSGSLNDLWKIVNNRIVPLTMLNISALIIENTVRINWQTAQEINTSHFVIERSADGTNFSALGSVVAAGNSSSIRNYSFKDNLPLQGISFYRVRMVDKDGSYKYSSVVRTTLNPAKKNITVFPNPVISTTTINLTTSISAPLKFILYDAKGRVVIGKQIPLLAGTNSFIVDMTNLAKGVYTAVIIWDKENKKVRILKE